MAKGAPTTKRGKINPHIPQKEKDKFTNQSNLCVNCFNFWHLPVYYLTKKDKFIE